MSLKQKENKVRLEKLVNLENFLKEKGENVMRIGAIKSASKSNYSLMSIVPTEDGEEMVIRYEVSCIRKNTNPYELAEEYRFIVEEEEEREREKAEKKAQKTAKN